MRHYPRTTLGTLRRTDHIRKPVTYFEKSPRIPTYWVILTKSDPPIIFNRDVEITTRRPNCSGQPGANTVRRRQIQHRFQVALKQLSKLIEFPCVQERSR